MIGCAFTDCINHNNPSKETIILGDLSSITYHLFPKDPILREKWIKQMNQEDFEPTATSALCSLHFNKDYFINDGRSPPQLKPDAIPTEFEFVFKKEIEIQEQMVCCAYKCGNVYRSDQQDSADVATRTTFHAFPLDQPELCAQWLTAMNCTQIDAAEAVLCSEHFDQSCFVFSEEGEKMLIADAVPSIFVFPEGEEGGEMEEGEMMPMDTTENEQEPMDDNPQIKHEITEEEFELIRHHDEVVNILIDESQKLVEVSSKRIRLEKKKEDLCYLLNAFIRETPVERSRIKTMRPLIKEVEEVYQQILVRCLEPCYVEGEPQLE